MVNVDIPYIHGLFGIYTYAKLDLSGELLQKIKRHHPRLLDSWFIISFWCLKRNCLKQNSFFVWSLWLNHSHQPSVGCTCVCEHLVWAEKPIWMDICVSLGIAINAWQPQETFTEMCMHTIPSIHIHHPSTLCNLPKGQCLCVW